MKKLLLLVPVVFVLGALGATGCTKCSPKTMMPGGEKKPAEKMAAMTLAVDQIGTALAPIICDKYSSCNPAPDFSKDKCLQDISAGITENLKQNPDLKVEQAGLDACVKAIQDSACEALNSATPPAGCEFLQ